MKKSSQKTDAILNGLTCYLKEKGEENILPDVTKSLENMVSKLNKSDSIIVTSVVPLSKPQLNEIGKLIKKNLNIELPIVNEIEKQLLAGFTVKVNEWFFDGSVSNQLNNIRRSLKSI